MSLIARLTKLLPLYIVSILRKHWVPLASTICFKVECLGCLANVTFQ